MEEEKIRRNILRICLLAGYLYLGAVGLDDVGILQLAHQISLDRVNVDPSELVTLGQLLGGQTLGLVLGGQGVDSCDYFVHIHSLTSYIAVNGHRNSIFFGFAVYGSQLDFSQPPDGNLAALGNGLVRFFTGETVNGGFSGGDILGGQTSANAKAGGNDAVQPEGGHGVPELFDFRFRDLYFPKGNLGNTQVGSSGGSEALEDIGGDLLSHKEITASFSNADITYSLSSDSRAHKSTQKIPVAQRILLEELRPEADAGAVFFHKAILFQVVGKIYEHFPLRIFVTAEGIETIRHTEQETGQLQLPGREEAGICGNVLSDTCVDLVPQLCQKQPVLRRVGDFVDIASVHNITKGYYTTAFFDCKEVFLERLDGMGYNGGKKAGETMVIGIIGGGASGMAAALAAAENESNQVILMERQARVGRKLQATGNGRCNLTNLHCGEGGYHGDDAAFAETAITEFDPRATLDWFRGLGLFTVAEESGRVYPYSDQANSVVDVLRFALEKPNITQKLGFEVEKVKRTAQGFRLEGGGEAVECEKLIVACGGLAGTKLGGTMSGYKLLRSLGHHCTKLRPTLVQLKSGWGGVAGLKGVRANCHAAIYRNNTLHAESTGELQFTEYGLSGPVIFEVSRDVCHEKGDWFCGLDFLPEISGETLLEELKRRRTTDLPAGELLTGILHNRLGRVLTQSAGISAQTPVRELKNDQLLEAVRCVKEFEVSVTEPMGMDSAQVTAGGIVTKEFDPRTMESRLVPGLYACGEVLDIDGDCGGYNLQWAWSSGRLAGLCAGGIK